MSNTTENNQVIAFTKYRDYYKENKYLSGLVTTTHLVKTDKLQDEVIVVVPKGVKVTVRYK